MDVFFFLSEEDDFSLLLLFLGVFFFSTVVVVVLDDCLMALFLACFSSSTASCSRRDCMLCMRSSSDVDEVKYSCSRSNSSSSGPGRVGQVKGEMGLLALSIQFMMGFVVGVVKVVVGEIL